MVRRLFVHSHLKRVTIYLLLVTVLLIPTFGAYGVFNLDTEILPSEKIDYIINSINLHDDINNMSDNCLSSTVVSFDVSENGMVVLGLRGDEIAVLDSDNKPIHDFHFKTNGSFYVRWHEENIVLILVRSSLTVEFTLDGDIIDVSAFDDGSGNNNKILNEIREFKDISFDGNMYSTTNGLKIMNAIVPSRIKVEKTDSDLNITTVYKAKNSNITSVISTVVVVVMFAVVCFVFSKKKNDGESSPKAIKAKKIESVWFVVLPAFLIADRLQSAYFIKHGQTNTSIAISAVCIVVLIAGGLVSLYFYVKNKNGNDDGR